MISYPSINEAIIIWHESLSGVLQRSKEEIKIEYIFHTTGVAVSAYKIAQKCALNHEKAYVLGLLHDYGKIQNEKYTGKAHFIFGYEKMLEKGYEDVAKICLSHSFPKKDFSFNDYSSYAKNDLIQTKEILSKQEYDDYDRLIQLCDMFFEKTYKMPYQKRLEGIRSRYNLTKEQTKDLEEGARINKEYFDRLCGQDIYEILDIKN